MNTKYFLEVVPAIDINDLEEIVNKHSGNPEKLEDAIRSFIKEARIASGDALPLFSLSDKAREHLSRISGH